jgi:hypothetical protein
MMKSISLSSVLCIVVATIGIGVYTSAWKTLFDTICAWLGFSSPSTGLDSVGFVDELVRRRKLLEYES